jgi:hypothetical protein
MTGLAIGARRIFRWLILAFTVVALTGAFPGVSVAAVERVGDVDASFRTACVAGAAACPIRIRFAAGAYAGQARSRLTGINAEKWFVVNARAGQGMIVIVKGAGATRGTVRFPNGEQDGQPGGRVFDGTLPVSGDYRIRVTESLMGEAWSGRVDVLVVIY